MPSSILLIGHWILSSATKYRICLSFIRRGKNCWRNTGTSLAWALFLAHLSKLWYQGSPIAHRRGGVGVLGVGVGLRGRGWVWGEAWWGVLQSSFRVPIFVSIRAWQSFLSWTVSTSLQTKSHLLQFARGEVRELSAWVPLCVTTPTAPCLVSTRCSPRPGVRA